MPRNKASRLRLAEPEPEPEPEPRDDWSDGSHPDWGSEHGSESESGSAASLGSAEAYAAQLHEIFQRADRNGDGSLKRAGTTLVHTPNPAPAGHPSFLRTCVGDAYCSAHTLRLSLDRAVCGARARPAAAQG